MLHPFSQGLQLFVEEEKERMEEPGVMGDHKEIVFSSHNRAFAHMNSQQSLYYVQNLHKC